MGSSNVYTVLLLIAALALAAACVYIFLRSGDLFGGGAFSTQANLQLIKDAGQTLLKA